MERLNLSNQERNFVVDGLHERIRCDGRGPLDYRPIYVQTGVLATTDGSARVQIDTTTVLVGVKAEMTAVGDSSQCVNRLRFFVDFSAIGSPMFAGRGGSDFGEELANVLYAAYDSDAVLPDLKKLIVASTFMWTVHVDAVILRYGGNIMDAMAMAVKAALVDTRICEVIARPADEGKVMLDLPDECKLWSFDVSRAPLVVGVHKIGDQNVLDADEREEACSTSLLYIGVQIPECDFSKGSPPLIDDECLVTCTHKSLGGSLELESTQGMLDVGVRAARNLNAALMHRLQREGEQKRRDPLISMKGFLH